MANHSNTNSVAQRERAARQREARSRSARAVAAMQANPIQNRQNASLRVLPGSSVRDISSRHRNVIGATRYVAGRGANVGGILIILFVILLLVNILSSFLGTPDRTVLGLLTSMQNVPEINLDFLNWSEVALGDWGIFNWFRDFVGYFIDIVSVVGFLGGSLINGVLFIVWFLKWVLFGI